MIHKSLAVLSSTVCLLIATRAVSAADLYKIDPENTSVVFAVGHSGFSYTYGMFREAAGTYVIDETNPANNNFRLVIQADSLFTNQDKRDERLRGVDFFNVKQFPTITFETTKCEATTAADGGKLFKVTGNLTIHGQTRSITLPLRMLGGGIGPYNDHRTGFLCQVEIKRTDFGMTNLLEGLLVGDAVGVTISFEGSLQPPAGAPAATTPAAPSATPRIPSP